MSSAVLTGFALIVFCLILHFIYFNSFLLKVCETVWCKWNVLRSRCMAIACMEKADLPGIEYLLCISVCMS